MAAKLVLSRRLALCEASGRVQTSPPVARKQPRKVPVRRRDRDRPVSLMEQVIAVYSGHQSRGRSTGGASRGRLDVLV